MTQIRSFFAPFFNLKGCASLIYEKWTEFRIIAQKLLYISSELSLDETISKGISIMKIRTLILTGAMIAMSSMSAYAQFSITKSVIGSGGGPSAAGTFSLNGTIGQAIIGPVTGGQFTDNQGFWYENQQTGAVKQLATLPDGYALGQNYPNPFNPSTTIRFSVPERSKVTMRVMNLLGQEVARVINNESYDAGTYEVDFLENNLPSGTYVYRLEAGNIVMTKKMVLMK